MQASGITESIPFTCTSWSGGTLFSCSPCFLHSVPQLLNNHHGGGGWWGYLSLGSSHSHLEAWALWRLWHFLLSNMAGDIFISHPQSLKGLWISPSILIHGCFKQQQCMRSFSHFEFLIFFLNQSGKTTVKRILWLNQATWIILYLKVQWFVSLITSAKAHCSGM